MFVAFYFVVNNHDPINLDRIMTTRFSYLGCGARMTWNLVSVTTYSYEPPFFTYLTFLFCGTNER